MKQKLRPLEVGMNALFFACGFIAVVFVVFISVYLIISGLPAIQEVGLADFLFGTEWASTASEPKFGILPFILTSIYGTCGAIVLGVPVGFMTAVFLAKVASPKLAAVVRPAVDLLAGIPSVVYGLIGMMVLVPAVRELFDLPDGSSLFCAIIVLAVMILPSIISVSETALKAGRGHGHHHGGGQRGQYAHPLLLGALFDHRRGQRDGLRLRPAAPGPVLHRPGPLCLYHAHQRGAQHASQAEEGVI